MAKNKENSGKNKNTFWPTTKKEFEKAIFNAKRALDASEKYLKELSMKGVKKTHQVSCSLQREKLYYELGRLLMETSKSKWASDAKIDQCIAQIKKLDKELKK